MAHSTTTRQYVRFAFYRLDAAWRRLPAHEQTAHKQELSETIRAFNRRMLLRPYSTIATRADTELLLWQIAESIEPFHGLAAAILNSRMGAYLSLQASYLSQTKRSIYEIRDNPNEDVERLIIAPSEAKYLFVYPFVKTRPWYLLSLEERQRMMDEHIRVGRKYPAVKLNTTYSFGLDDQDFVVAFETDEPSDFLDLVQDLRETEASLYTVRDVPLYTCLNLPLDEALDALGGPRIAQPRPVHAPRPEVWVEACPLSELPDGARKLVYVDGQQVALFNVGGELRAISNRCTHARGPLSQGKVEQTEHGCVVHCPWHTATFSLSTGKPVAGVATLPVPVHEVEVRDGLIYVRNA
jgi:chlorite dismutase